MSNAAKLKKKAVELEQKKQFDKALSLYIQFLQESEGTLDDVDIPINNRVGDLLLRTGNTADALNYYEKAVDLYADRGFHNNAIALCNKVLRQSPGRASIYYKLGKISATKGFKSDAKKNFLEYADRMQKVGQIDEAFRALKEFADLCPDQDDIRLMLAEQLTKQNRQDEAMEQLQKLHDKLDSEGRMAEARATVDRMKSIDPEAVPRVSGSYRPQKSQDLIFLDTSFEQASRTRQSEPAATPATPATPAPPPPAGRQVSDPDLVVLTLGDQRDTPVSPVHNAAVANAFNLELDAPVDDATASSALPMLDVPDTIDTPPNAGASLELNAKQDPAPVDLAADEPSYASGPRLGIDYASDLAADVIMPPESSDLFDFRAPPRSDGAGMSVTPVPGLDPDVAFPSFDLDTALPSADEITSGGSLAAALDPGDTLGIELGDFDSDSAERLAPDGMAAGSDVGSASLDLDWPASDDATPPAAATPTIDIEGLELGSPVPVSSAAPLADELDAAEIVDVVADFPGESDADVAATPNANAPTGDYPRVTGDVEIVASIPVAADAPVEPEPDRRAGWEVQRAHAERLLEAGDRAGGVHELEQVAAELERIGDLERALSIVDELIRLSPDSVRHHQKRVELAFRSNDRVKLIDAYLELGDALFRSGEERKARAVYQRVLELAPDDPRAQAAVESVASASPPAGSGAIAAIPPSASERPQSGPRPPDKHVAYQSVPSNGARPTGGVTAPPPSRKPSPLDRSEATHGEFVDLGDWLRSGENPKSTRMVAEEKPPSGDEQADFQEMLKRFKQGVAENVDEEDYESHYDLGVAYKEMGLVDEAVAEFQKALRGTSNRVRACEALGQCFVEKEQYHVAASVLSRAIALGEGDDHHLVGVLYLLGKATEALGKPSAALDYYQRVFAVDIEFRDVAERISVIERKAT